MRLFGFDVSVRKAARSLQGVDDSRGWVTVHDTYPGSWQQDVQASESRISANWAVFACQTLIAADIGKLGVKLTEWNAADRIYEDTKSPAVSPFFAKPNGYQTWQKFIESWVLSKVGAQGNAYILKERDARGVVVAAHVLDPCKVTPLVSDRGDVFYRLNADRLAGIPEYDGGVPIPASEIIHDRMWCLYHPLVGISPLFASGLAATQGLEIQTFAAQFFRNRAMPGGILVSPQRLEDEFADKYKARFEANYSGQNRGRVAVLGNGLKYEPITQNAVDSELVAQLKLTAEMVCSTYHVPAYKIGAGATPTYQNAEVLNQIYYDVCLQPLVQAIEACLDEGLDLPQKGFRAQLDEDDLLRMDKGSQMEFAAKGVERAIFSPDEARRKFNLPPVPGGKFPMAQQQNYSLEALAKRDASDDPFATAKPAPATPATPKDGAADASAAKDFATALIRKAMEREHG